MTWKTRETPPNSNRAVLALVVGEDIPVIARYFGGKYGWFSYGRELVVTHWHPLPKPPSKRIKKVVE